MVNLFVVTEIRLKQRHLCRYPIPRLTVLLKKAEEEKKMFRNCLSTNNNGGIGRQQPGK